MAITKHDRKGRPSLGERFPVTTKVHRPEQEQIDEICSLTGITRTALLEKLLKDGLSRIDMDALRAQENLLLGRKTG